MRYVLNLIYLITVLLLSPWLVYKALTTGKYRRGLWAKLSGRAVLRESDKPCAWFHGVSVGEVHLLRQVIAAFRRRHPDWDVVVSTTTDTGYDEATKRFPDLPVFFWPLDFSWAVGRALGRVRPNLLLLAEGELWPNLLACAKRHAVRVAVLNGRMSPRSHARYRKLRWLVGGVFRRLDLVAAQNEEYAANYRSLGVPPERVHVIGSVKYDGVCMERHHPRTRELGRLFGIKERELVLVAGSTQAPEEQVILDIYRRARKRFPNLRLIVVPRQKDRFDEVAALLARAGEPFVRRSQLATTHHSPLTTHAILVDTIGELGAVWGLADVAYVGGSLDGKRGGQNMIEPAAYGAAVLFGPHTWNFKETVVRLLEHRAAIQVQDAAALEREVTRLLADSDARAALGEAAQTFVRAQQGATERTMDALDLLLASQRGAEAPLAA